MPLRRFRRPGLLGSIGSADVITGTSVMTSRVLQRRRERAADEAATTERPEDDAREPVREPLSRSAASPAPDLVGQLSELARLRTSGAISEEEFRSSKARLLTG